MVYSLLRYSYVLWAVAVEEVKLHNYRNREFSTRLLNIYTPYISYFIFLYIFYFLSFFIFIACVILSLNSHFIFYALIYYSNHVNEISSFLNRCLFYKKKLSGSQPEDGFMKKA